MDRGAWQAIVHGSQRVRHDSVHKCTYCAAGWQKKARHARNEAAGRSDTRSSPGPGLSVPCVDSCSGIGLPVPCTRAGESVCSLAGRAPATLASDLPEHVSPSPTLGLHPCQSLPGWLLLGLRSWLECHHEAALSRKCCPVILCNENSL